MTARAEQRRGVVLAIILTGYLLVLIDVSILMVALPRRASTLSGASPPPRTPTILEPKR
jgi:hypothetical protein